MEASAIAEDFGDSQAVPGEILMLSQVASSGAWPQNAERDLHRAMRRVLNTSSVRLDMITGGRDPEVLSH